MPYPYDQLTENEQLLVHQHPHWKVLLLPLSAAAALTAGCGYLAALTAGTALQRPVWIALGVLAVLALLWFGLAPWLRWKTTHFALTTDKVMFREGVLSRTGMNIPLRRISSVRQEVDINDRLFGCGSLIVESESAEPLRFTDIPAVQDVHNQLYEAVYGNPNQLTHTQ